MPTNYTVSTMFRMPEDVSATVDQLTGEVSLRGGNHGKILIRLSNDSDTGCPWYIPVEMTDYRDKSVATPWDIDWPVGMEITPRYGGYWTQLVRTLCIGEPSEDLVKAHKMQLETMENSRKQLYPGNKLGNMLKDMWRFGKERGFEPKLPFGHVLGLDLDEGGRGSLESDFLFTENTSVTLHPTMTLGDMDYSIFWGDNYLVTEKGGERINKCSTDLTVV